MSKDWSLSDSIEKDRQALLSFFSDENIELELTDLRRTYSNFSLKKINGKELKGNKIIMSFYNDLIYCSIDTRKDYAGKLNVFFIKSDRDIPSYEKKFNIDEYNKRGDLSLQEILKNLGIDIDVL